MARSRSPGAVGQPDVVVDFEFENGCFFLVITNIGAGPAHAVSTSFEPSFSGLDGCREIPLLELFDGIGFLSPGKAVRAFVDAADRYFAREEPTVIETEVSFRDGDDNTFHSRATHDLGIYRDLPHLPSAASPKVPPDATGVQPDTTGVPRGESAGRRRRESVDVPTGSDAATFELYEDRGGEYRWRLVHANGQIIADSGEGYASRGKARQGIASVQRNASGAAIRDDT